MISIAIVKIWNEKVGTVTWNSETEVSLFQYDANFIKYGLQLSPIQLPLNEYKTFSFPELKNSETFKGLPGLLADSLPDSYGSELINMWLTSQGRPEDSLNPVELLCFVGKRGMGALEFEPATPKTNPKSSKIEINSLAKISEYILLGKKNFRSRLSPNDKKSMQEIIQIGTSAGGAKAKAIIAYNPKTGEVRSGQTDAPDGFSHWIIKFDGVKIDNKIIKGYGKIEFAYYKMAIDCGIEMNECRLFEENGKAHFMTKRFDRIGNKKLHMQSFGALRHFDYLTSGSSYEQIFETMRYLKLTYPEMEQMYRRMVFNVMAINYDDHAKNFAFRMDVTGKWKLSPAFDLAYVRINNFGEPRRSSSINGKRRDITKLDLWDIARRQGIKRADEIINEISDVVSRWKHYADSVNINSQVRDGINKNLVLMK